MEKMEGRWLKFADFAREIGCTPANIYRYVKGHPAELEPEVIKEGRFMVISPAGQEYIRSLMHPKTMSESAAAQQISHLQATLSATDHEWARTTKKLAETEARLDKALRDIAEHQRLLAAAADENAAKDAAIAEATARADAAEQKATQVAKEAAERAREDQETIGKLKEDLANEDAARAEAVAYAEGLANRNLIERILNRGVR